MRATFREIAYRCDQIAVTAEISSDFRIRHSQVIEYLDHDLQIQLERSSSWFSFILARVSFNHSVTPKVPELRSPDLSLKNKSSWGVPLHKQLPTGS
jgi:hypothetical protein